MNFTWPEVRGASVNKPIADFVYIEVLNMPFIIYQYSWRYAVKLNISLNFDAFWGLQTFIALFPAGRIQKFLSL